MIPDRVFCGKKGDPFLGNVWIDYLCRIFLFLSEDSFDWLLIRRSHRVNLPSISGVLPFLCNLRSRTVLSIPAFSPFISCDNNGKILSHQEDTFSSSKATGRSRRRSGRRTNFFRRGPSLGETPPWPRSSTAGWCSANASEGVGSVSGWLCCTVFRHSD